MRRAWTTMLAVAVALTAVAVGQDLPSPDTRAVVEALLKRSRELEDVRFCVPQALWKQYLREELGDPAPVGPSAPVPWIAEAGVYRLTVEQGKGVLEATVRVRVFDALAGNKLAVLSAARVWKHLTLTVGGGEAAAIELPALDGFLRFSPPAAGVYIVKGQTDVKGNRVPLDIPPTVRTVFEFSAPPGLEGRLEGREDVIPALAGKPTAGAMAVAPCKSLVMTYGPPPVAFEREPRYQLHGTVAWNLDADVQHVSADLGVDVLVGRSDRIELALPDGADRVKISGPEVRDVQGTSVFLRGRLRGQVRLNVEFDLRYGPGASRRLAGLGLREGRWIGGTLLVAGGGGDDEVLPERAEGLTERTLSDLPAQARAMLRGQPVAAYGITGSTWSASVEALKLGQFAMRESIADLAHYQVALQPDGAMMCKAEYEIRNRNQQFLRLALPPGATVLLARVNEKAQPLVPLPERPGVFVLPLVRSDATVKGLVTFPVEIVYLTRTAALGKSGTARLPLPTLDIPIAYAWGEAYLPEGLAISRWAGPMRQVEQFSSETAVASLGYGAGELAAGYKAEGRIHAEAAGKKPEPAKATGRTATPGWFEDRTDKPWGGEKLVMGVGSPARKPAAVQATPPSGKPGSGPTAKADPAGLGKGEGEGKGKTGTETEKMKERDDGKDAYAYTLGRNYWRTGQEYYQQGNYESAEKALRKVTELAPGSQDSTNALRLLSNLDVVRGQAKLTGAQEKAAGKGVQQEAAQQRQGLVQKQSEQLAKGFDALKAGKRAEAQVQFQAAQAYNTKLLEQGETANEQDALLAEARKEMQATAAAEQTKSRELIDQAKKLSAKKEYSQALNLAKSARQRLKANEFGIDAKSNASISGDAQQATELVEQLTLATAQEEGGRETPVHRRVLAVRQVDAKDGGWMHRTGEVMKDNSNQAMRKALAGEEQMALAEMQKTAPGEPVLTTSLRQMSEGEEAPGARPKERSKGLVANRPAPAPSVILEKRLDRATELNGGGRHGGDGTSGAIKEEMAFDVGNGMSRGATIKHEDRIRRGATESLSEAQPQADEPGVPEIGSIPGSNRMFDDGRTTPKAEPIVERAYDIRDMLVTVPNVVGLQVGGGVGGQDGAFFGDGDESTGRKILDGPEQRRKAAEKVAQTIQSAVDPASWRELERITGGGIQISNGQLIVRQREDNQKKIANLLGQLREARGARVQEGEKLLTQAANATDKDTNQRFSHEAQPSSSVVEFRLGSGMSLSGMLAGQAGQPEEALANDPEFQKFVADNYRWANDRNKTVAANAPAGGAANPTYDNRDLAQRLRTNKGQKTNVTSWNVKVDERAAARLGLKFNVGNNDLRYTVVDEAQLRTLAELEASGGSAAAIADRNPQRQDTIVGTDAMLSNGMTANVSFAADRGNVLDAAENPIALAHDRYLLVSNGDYLTAVRSQPMANWKQASAYVPIIEAPQKIEIPRVGVPVRFEKKLASADETLDLTVTYEWKGAH